MLNYLENEQEIEKYRQWLKSKPTHTLRIYIKNFIRDIERENPLYIKHSLRIELAEDEINSRLN